MDDNKSNDVVKTFDIKGTDQDWMPTEQEIERLAKGGILFLYGSDIIVDGFRNTDKKLKYLKNFYE